MDGAHDLCLTSPPGDSAWPHKRLLKIRDHSSFILVSVLVSYCSCNRLNQTQWLKTKQIYYLKVLEVRSPKWISLMSKWQKSRCWQSCIPFRGSGGLISLPSPVSRGCPAFSQQSHNSDLYSCCHISLPDCDSSASLFHF